MPTLRRTLGRWDLTAIGVNQVVGAAIFLLPADVARQVGNWGPVMFAAIGLTSLLVALCFAEVGSRFETTGGPIGPARVAFGRFVGFEVGWMLWFSRVSSGASVINGLALALGFYWPALVAGPAPGRWSSSAVLGGLTWANLRGIKQASWLVNGFTIGKVLPLVIFVLVGDLGRRFQPRGALGPAAAGRRRRGSAAADLRLRWLRSDRRAGRRSVQPSP